MALTYGADAFSVQRLSERRQPSASHPRHSRRRPVRQVSSKDMPRLTLRAQGHPYVASIPCLRHEHRVGHLRFQACDAHTDVLLANAASPNSPSHLNVLKDTACTAYALHTCFTLLEFQPRASQRLAWGWALPESRVALEALRRELTMKEPRMQAVWACQCLQCNWDIVLRTYWSYTFPRVWCLMLRCFASQQRCLTTSSDSTVPLGGSPGGSFRGF